MSVEYFSFELEKISTKKNGSETMDYRASAASIVAFVGGRNNIESVTHCMTRLRFHLKDESKADKASLEKTEGVIAVVQANGEYQVVCGQKVSQIYHAMHPFLNDETPQLEVCERETDCDNGAICDNAATRQEVIDIRKPSMRFQKVLQIIAQIFTPLVPAIAASGLIKGILTAVKLLMKNRGVDISTSDTYILLYGASQVIFYYFPILLAMTSARAFRCNEIVAMVIGGALVYPQIDAIIQDFTVKTTFFGIPITKGVWKIGETEKVFSYTESVIPILLAIFAMAYLERLLKKIIPEILEIILVPGLELIIMLPLTLCLLGPIGIWIGNGIQFCYSGLIGISPILGGFLIGGLWGVFVIFGAHRALVPIGINDVALTGKQNLLAFAGAANFAQGGAALGVMLRAKSSELKQVSASAALAAGLVGITEPAIYGCNLRLKTPMICAIISGAVGGAIMGAGNVFGDAFANNGVLTIFTYAAFGMRSFLFYLVGILVSFFGAAVLTYFVKFDESGMTQNSKE